MAKSAIYCFFLTAPLNPGKTMKILIRRSIVFLTNNNARHQSQVDASVVFCAYSPFRPYDIRTSEPFPTPICQSANS